MDVIEMLRNLFYSEAAQAEWKEDPQGYLERQGASDLSVAQINEAAQVACSPTDLGASVNVGGNQTVGDTGTGQTGGPAPVTPPPVTPPPPPPPPPPPVTMPPPQQIEETINYYVTNVTETNVDDRDTSVDNSVDVINVGGEVNIDQDTVIASGDGAVAAGGDNTGVNTGDGGVAVGDDANAPVVIGDGNVAVDDSGPVTVGDGNIVGDDNTVGDGNIAVDNSAEGRGESGDVIIGDGNENNDVDIDINRGEGEGGRDGENGGVRLVPERPGNEGEGNADGAINIGVGSGDTTQDNHTEDNDGIDDKDRLDLDVTVDDHSVEDNDVFDVDANFGGGQPDLPLRDELAKAERSQDAEQEPNGDVVKAAVMPEEIAVEEPAVEIIEAVEDLVEPAVAPEPELELTPDPEPEMMEE